MNIHSPNPQTCSKTFKINKKAWMALKPVQTSPNPEIYIPNLSQSYVSFPSHNELKQSKVISTSSKSVKHQQHLRHPPTSAGWIWKPMEIRNKTKGNPCYPPKLLITIKSIQKHRPANPSSTPKEATTETCATISIPQCRICKLSSRWNPWESIKLPEMQQNQ